MYEQGDASLRASRFVKNLGFKLQGEPEFSMPVLPADITSISDKDLMQLLSEAVSWMDYVEVYFVAAQIDERQEQQELDQIEATEQIKHKAEKTVSAAKAFVLQSKEYKDQKDKLLVVYAKRKMLEVVYNSLERRRFLISREITRRKYGND